jgi:DNA-binding SARP family transcriptional activator
MIKIKLFGSLELTVDGVQLNKVETRGMDRLLVFLLLRQGRQVSKTYLLDSLWSELTKSDSLRQCISNLRGYLGEESKRIIRNRESIGLNIEGMMVDVFDFSKSIEENTVSSLQKAVKIYTAPLLEEWNDPWIMDYREKYRTDYLNSLHSLSEIAMKRRDYTNAIRFQSLYVKNNPTEENGWNDLMEMMIAGGERIKAINLFHRFSEYIKPSGIEPSKSMLRKYIEIVENQNDYSNRDDSSGSQNESIGGAEPLNSHYYITRDVDTITKNAIIDMESLIVIKGPRQCGKSSLLARAMQTARDCGDETLITNFEILDKSSFNSMESLCRSLMEMMAAQLNIQTPDSLRWNPLHSPIFNLEQFVIKVVIPSLKSPLVWGMDGVDRLFQYPFSGEIFSMLRAWHEKRSLEPQKPWRRLSIALALATEAHLYIRDLNKSPFNVGTKITLEDFSYSDISKLNELHDFILDDDRKKEKFYQWTGGHPYLVRRGLYELTLKKVDFQSFIRQSEEDNGPFGDHLRHMTSLIREDPDLLGAMKAMLAGKSCPEEAFFRLRSAGVLSGESPLKAQPRCELYAVYLKKKI